MSDLISLLLDLANFEVLELSMLLLERTRLEALARVTASGFFVGCSSLISFSVVSSVVALAFGISVATGS